MKTGYQMTDRAQIIRSLQHILPPVATDQKPTTGLKRTMSAMNGTEETVATDQKPTTGLKQSLPDLDAVWVDGRDGPETHYGIETRAELCLKNTGMSRRTRNPLRD